MPTFLIFALAGLVAQLVDGSLGMGYGITSTTVLLAAGTAPAAASASVHLAQLGTSLASGAAHRKFGNVDWPVVARIAGPGAIGAAAGAVLLSNVSADLAKPWMAGLLLVLGGYVLVRFSLVAAAERITRPKPGARLLAPLGLFAGFITATGGGGWGPVATTSLLSSGRLAPRKVIGSVSAAEFVVSVAASVGFFFALRGSGISPVAVAGLLAGGVLAAVPAAWLVRVLPARLIGVGAGGLIVLTNTGTLLSVLEVPVAERLPAYAVLVVGWIAALTVAVRSLRRERRQPELAAAGGEVAVG